MTKTIISGYIVIDKPAVKTFTAGCAIACFGAVVDINYGTGAGPSRYGLPA
jgi:hypothetical protein